MHHGVRITDAALVAAATMSDRYIADRFLPDKAIDLVDESASRLRMEIDSRPVEVDEIERAVRRLEIEEMALAKESDPASQHRLTALRKELADRREQLAALGDRWRTEKEHIAKISAAKEQLETLRREAERAERDLELERASELRYGRIPSWSAADGGRGASCRRSRPTARCSRKRSAPDDIAAVVVELDRHPGRSAAGGRDRQAAADGGVARRPGGRPARGGRRRRPTRSAGSGPASPTRTARPGASCSSARPASARPSWPRRWPSSCSTTSGRWSAST